MLWTNKVPTWDSFEEDPTDRICPLAECALVSVKAGNVLVSPTKGRHGQSAVTVVRYGWPAALALVYWWSLWAVGGGGWQTQLACCPGCTKGCCVLSAVAVGRYGWRPASHWPAALVVLGTVGWPGSDFWWLSDSSVARRVGRELGGCIGYGEEQETGWKIWSSLLEALWSGHWKSLNHRPPPVAPDLVQREQQTSSSYKLHGN